MIETIVLGLSILIQLTAAGFAVRLARFSQGRIGWLLIAAAMGLMTVRHGITFFRIVTGERDLPPDLTAELAALTISVLMLVGVLAIIPIISRFQREQEALAESEELFSRTFHVSPGLFAISRPGDGAHYDVNKTWMETLGYSHEEAMAHSAVELGIWADVKQRERFVERLEKEGSVRDFEAKFRTKDGRELDVLVAGESMGFHGEPRLLVVSYDITERKQAEEALRESEERVRLLFESTGEAVYGLDLEDNCTFANPAAARLLGYDGPDPFLGRNMHNLIHHTRSDGTQYPAEECRIYQAYRQNRGVHVDDEVLWRKDGTSFAVEYRSFPMRRGDEVIGAVVTFVDITERLAQQAQLQQAQKMETVGQLTGGVAHDFNNLLTAIIGNLDLLKRRMTDKAELHLLDIALRAGHRGAELTQRLLAFSRRQPLRPEPTDVNRRVPDLTALLHRTLGEHIEIETVLAGGLWHAMIDPAQLDSALLNLALNARDAMPDGGKLTIETVNTHLDRPYAEANVDVAAGQYVLVAVSDTGHGMAPEVIEKAFDPFFTTKSEGGGSGLGLSMVYGFLRQSGGHVKIYSEVGHGTTVKLYLPKAGDTAREEVATAGFAQALPEGSETILVVEDDSDVRSYVISALGMLGYDVIDAADGPQALERLGGISKIDLLLTDVVLPGGMTGPEVAVEVRKRFPEVKVLYTSGYTENAILHHGRLDNGIELLGKPYTVDTLARRVRLTLDGDG